MILPCCSAPPAASAAVERALPICQGLPYPQVRFRHGLAITLSLQVKQALSLSLSHLAGVLGILRIHVEGPLSIAIHGRHAHVRFVPQLPRCCHHRVTMGLDGTRPFC